MHFDHTKYCNKALNFLVNHIHPQLLNDFKYVQNLRIT